LTYAYNSAMNYVVQQFIRCSWKRGYVSI